MQEVIEKILKHLGLWDVKTLFIDQRHHWQQCISNIQILRFHWLTPSTPILITRSTPM